MQYIASAFYSTWRHKESRLPTAFRLHAAIAVPLRRGGDGFAPQSRRLFSVKPKLVLTIC